MARNYLDPEYKETSAAGTVLTKKGFQVNYLTMGKKNRPGTKIKELKALVLHWIGEYPKQLPINTRSWWESEQVYGSAHYIIGHDGAILKTLPEDEIGYHIGSTTIDPVSKKVYTDFARKMFGDLVCLKATNNSYAIGIEMCPIEKDGTFSEETLEATRQLVVDILTRNKKTVDILTNHWEICGWKRCPVLFANYPEKFTEFRKQVNARLPAALQVPENTIKQQYPV
jgi:N-acetylmuramoyl-L-alanine amidase